MRIPILEPVPDIRGVNGWESLFQVGEGDPHFGEQIRLLRTRIEIHATSRQHNMVAVTSAIAGDGKTLTAANLAASIASGGRNKVLLIDADIRKGSLSAGIGFRNSPGLTDYVMEIASMEQVTRTTGLPGLHFVSAGTEVESPGEIFAMEGLRRFLRLVRQDYDFVLLDVSPVLPVSDTVSLADHVDGFIFLFRACHTPIPLFRQAVEEVGEKRIIGVVLNAVEAHKQKYYDKYYGSYYRKSPTAKDPVA